MCVCFSASGVLKCKKDKTYDGGQFCAQCLSPEPLHQHELQKLRDVACVKPSIASPLRPNASRDRGEEEEEEQDPEPERDSPPWPEGLPFPPWNASLNLTDEHGNTVSLVCDIRKPTEVHRLQLNQTDSQEVEVNATVALDWECPMTRDKYEKLWKLIAYYSEVPVKLQREVAGPEGPGVAVPYRQDPEEDALYYTGVRAHLLAAPQWVAQPSIQLQLNRRQSTAKRVLLSYYAHFALTVSGKDAGRARARSWVMIEPAGAGQGAQTVLEGTSGQLSCNVKASESPSIFWVLPDGSVLRGPMEDPDGKFSVLSSGRLRIQRTELADSGAYQCIAQVRDEVDRAVYRLVVEPPATQPSGTPTVTLQKNPGEPLMLPCNALAVPEAQLSWVLPHKRMVHPWANASQVYMLPNGTLSIPTLQATDSGFYRCVAVNQQGADRFTVGVSVTKKGPGKASKRGRRPGGKTPPRLRGDVAEDEGGSGAGVQEGPSRSLGHPKGPETPPQTQEGAPTQKGRRKPKPWKNSERDPESTVAEGRRVFESRRRINMSNKQIHPERWADILARVRGKNAPKGTEGPEAVRSTTPSVSLDAATTTARPVVSPPSISPVQAAAGAEESSADASFFGEEEQVSGTASSSSARLERGQAGASLAAAKATGPDLEEFPDDEFSEKPEAPMPTEVVASAWAAAATPRTPFAPAGASPTPRTWGATSEEPTGENTATEERSAVHVAPMPTPRSREDPMSLGATSLAESEPEMPASPALQVNFRPDEETLKPQDSRHLTPTSTFSPVGSLTTEPAADFMSGQPHVPARGQRPEGTGKPPLAKTGSSTQGKPLRRKGTGRNSPMPPGGDAADRRPPRPRGPDGRRPRVQAAAPLDSVGEVTVHSVSGKDTTAVAAPTTPSPRKRPHGRRRWRPHRFRQRHPQTPPTPSAPAETFSAPPTPAPDAKTPKPADAWLLVDPTSWAEATVGTPKRVEVGTRAEHVTKGSPRRKHGKRPNKHRHSTSPATSPLPAPKPSPSSEHKRANTETPSPQTSPASTTVSLGTGVPREVTRVADDVTTPSQTPAPHHASEATVPATPRSGSDDREMENSSVSNTDDGQTDSLAPAQAGRNVAPPPGSEVFTGGALKERPPPSGSPAPGGWGPPSSAQPGRPHTDTPAPTSSGNSRDTSPILKEAEDMGGPSAVPPALAVSTVFRQEEIRPSTTLSSTPAQSSRRGQATRGGQGFYETTAALPASGKAPEYHLRPPTPVGEPAAPRPPTTRAAVAEPTPEPAAPTPTATPASPGSKDNAFFHHVGTPQAKAPPGNTEGTEPIWTTHELPTPSPREAAVPSAPTRGLGKEAPDDRSKNTLPRGPDPPRQEGGVSVFHPPTRVPPRGTTRPPPTPTQSPFRHRATLPSPRPFTNPPGATAFPSRVWSMSKHPGTPKLSSPATAAGPWHSSKPNHLPDRFHGHSHVFGSNSLPDLRDPGGQLPNARAPHVSGGRFPFLFNRTFSFPQLGVTLKPPAPTPPPAAATADRHLHPDPYNRIHSHSVSHLDFGPPAPPLWPRPRTTSPASAHARDPPPAHPTRSSTAFLTSAGPPSRSFHQSGAKLFAAAGPPASKFWTPGEKPRIVTKAPQTVSVTAEADVLLPCEATGKPKPFVTWTKASTGRAWRRLRGYGGVPWEGLLPRVTPGTASDGGRQGKRPIGTGGHPRPQREACTLVQTRSEEVERV